MYTIAAYALIAIAIFGAGYGTEYKISRGEILGYELAIEKANFQAHAVMVAAQDKVKKAEAEAVTANTQLELAHVQDIETINAIHDKYATVSVRDPYHKASCPNPVPKSPGTKIVYRDAEDSGELSAEFTAFLKSEALRADMVALDKNALLDFVRRNCGIID